MQVSSLSYREWVGVGGRSKTGGTFKWSADQFRIRESMSKMHTMTVA